MEGNSMIGKELDIRGQVADLMEKVLSFWKKEGKWDGDNRNMPFFGIDKDPIFALLLSAVVYQVNEIDLDMERFKEGLMDDFESIVLPHYLTSAIPSFAMMCTSKLGGVQETCYVDVETPFMVKVKRLGKSGWMPYYPLFKIKICDVSVVEVTPKDGERLDVCLRVKEADGNLGGMGMYFPNLDFDDLKVYAGDVEIPLIKPWEYDKLPVNDWFGISNVVYNKSLLYDASQQWIDIWASYGLNYYMIDENCPSFPDSDTITLEFRFAGCSGLSLIQPQSIFVNSFPVVNVSKVSFELTPSSPIVKLANEIIVDNDNSDSASESFSETSFFINLVNDDDCNGDFERIIVRKYCNERFNASELIRLSDRLSKKYATDFYAFHEIDGLQNGDKMRKLSCILKDVIEILQVEKLPASGVYAMLRHDSQNDDTDTVIKIAGLFTQGAFANGISVDAAVNPKKFFDKSKTRLLTSTMGGKNELTDSDEKSMLSKYYMQTNDRIVTRADLKSFCKRFLLQEGFSENTIMSISVDFEEVGQRRGVCVSVGFNKSVNKFGNDMPHVMKRMERLIEARSSGWVKCMVKYTY